MKLKEKLIHWLGGYTFQEHVTHSIITAEKPLIKVSIAARFNKYDFNDKEEREFLMRELSTKIAEEMLNNGYIKFSFPEEDVLRADAYIAKLD